MGELYGEVDPFTNEWRDGLASSIIREFNTKHPDEPNWDPHMKHWVVYDGPVDALWIENMNSVLDDSMTLCLANSERIKVRQELRMLFEVQDLAVASPATVSRCGMVYMTPEDLGWEVYVKSWIWGSTSPAIVEEGKPYVPCSQLRPRAYSSLKLDAKQIE
jgi:dynein heavy chain